MSRLLFPTLLLVGLLNVLGNEPTTHGKVFSASFQATQTAPVFQIPEELRSQEKWFRTGLKTLPEGMLVTGAVFLGSNSFSLQSGQAQSLSEVFSQTYQKIQADPEMADVSSALPYCFATTRPTAGNYLAYVPTKLADRPRCIVFLHGYGGNFLFYTWTLKQMFPDTVIVAPSWGVSWADGPSIYIDQALADLEKTIDRKLPGRWLMAISAGGDAGFRIYAENARAYRGYAALATAPKDETIKKLSPNLNLLMINGANDQRFPIDIVQRQAEAARRRSPGLKLEKIDGDHFFLLSHQKETADLLNRFVQ